VITAFNRELEYILLILRGAIRGILSWNLGEASSQMSRERLHPPRSAAALCWVILALILISLKAFSMC